MKKKSLLIIILYFCLLPMVVEAEVISFNVCISEHGAYNVNYDTTVATNVVRDSITNDDILNGHIPYPADVIETDKSKYNLNVSRYASVCYVENNEIKTCPTSEQLSKYNIYSTYARNQDDYVKITFNESNGTFNVRLKDIYNDELYVRYIYGNRIANTDGSKNAYEFPNEYLTLQTFTDEKGNSYKGYEITGITGSTPSNVNFATLEFYVKTTGNCSGVHLGNIGVMIPITDWFEIDNPAKSNPSYYGCDLVKQYYPVLNMTEDEKQKLDDLKQGYVPECYADTITYGEKSTLKQNISDNFDKLKQVFVDYKNQYGTSDLALKCEETHTQRKLTYTRSGTYWSISCTEEYTATGDKAKLVYAGDGFEYQTTYTVSRICNIRQKKKAKKLPQCVRHCGHRCYWNESDGVHEGDDGGPSDEFDECVHECDGGKYTQTCINSCYSKIYNNERDLSFLDVYSNTEPNEYKFERLASCTTDHGNNGESETGGCGEEYCVSDYCDENGWCESWNYVTPDPCSWHPQEDYEADMDDSYEELQGLMGQQQAEIDIGTYTYQIGDSYLVNDSGENYIFTVGSSTGNSNVSKLVPSFYELSGSVSLKPNKNTSIPTTSVKTGPNLKVDNTQMGHVLSTDSKTLGSDDPEREVSYHASYEKIAHITVSLPLSYINKVNSEVAYKTDEKSTAYKVDYRNDGFTSIPKFDALRFYNKNNERKYYTSILSKSINTVYKADVKRIYLVDYDHAQKNIYVASRNVGGGNFESDIQCYYGLYNNFYCPEPCETGDPGIQYIYRPIDLDDVFPNERNPRFNWTGTLNRTDKTESGAALYAEDNYMQYDVDPIKLTEDIESKGDSIYTDSGEYDYEFVLTKENIRNIRNYNENIRDYNGDCVDGDNDSCHNYLDYNMNCYKNSQGKEICTSLFLDNINGNSGSDSSANFITYSVGGFNTESRKRLAGCNNAYNRECVDLITMTSGGKYE